MGAHNLSDPDKVLIIVAHPDDAEISSGGSIARWVMEGKEVAYIVVTSGNKGTKDINISPYTLAELRESEQLEAAHVLGVKQIYFLRHNDGEVEVTFALRHELALLIRKFRPSIIITHDPWRPYQLHPDHRATGFAATDAIVAARDHLFLPAQGEVGLCAHRPREIYYTFPPLPDLIIDITDTISKKLEALSKHKSQVDLSSGWHDRIINMAKEWAKDETFMYAEAFKRVIL
ncbi:MAG: PIG-L deacetylase family protein [Thermodesulfobacteriota bacterium]|nr:PIG-L deacetylase family protein [Thermodesulfobacteriota bacterium]